MYTFVSDVYNEREKNSELRELLELELVTLVISNGVLGWFGGHVECKDDIDWVK